MTLRKFATLAVLDARMWDDTRRTAHRATFQYEPRQGFLYVRSRAISSRTNDNFDAFPAEEIEQAYLTFIGKPVFVNHHNDNHRRARGVIIDAALHKDTLADGQPDTWVEVLMEVDAVRFPKLAAAILRGDVERTSMGCFVPGTPITLSDGTRKPIDQITIGDEVLTHTGQTEPVTYVMVRDYEGIVYDIRSYGQSAPFILTPEHPVWVQRDAASSYKARKTGESRSTRCVCGESFASPRSLSAHLREAARREWDGEHGPDRTQTTGWVEARDVRVGDWVLTPAVRDTHHGSYPLARLLGYYLAEGNLGWDRQRYADRPISVEWNFHADEVEYVQEVCALAESLGYRPRTYVKNNCATVRVNSPEFAQLFLAYGGHHSWAKRLSPEVLGWSGDNLRALIMAYFNGDGCYRDDRVEAGTASQALAEQLYLVAVKANIPATPPVRQHSPSAQAAGSRPKFVLQAVLDPVKVVQPQIRVDQNGTWRRVTEMRMLHYSGPVHNFDVEGDDSYVAADVAAHNCDVAYSVCSVCSNQASTPMEYCRHIPSMKGSKVRRVTASGTQEDVLVYEKCISEGSLVLTARGEVPIEQVLAGDLVLTRRGWRNVAGSAFMGIKETVVVTLGDGRQITCTPDHRIATADGWVEAALLTPASLCYASALPAMSGRTPVGTASEAGVLVGVGVPGRAVGLGGMPVVSSVMAGRDGLQVGGLDAEPHAAEMVDLQTIQADATGAQDGSVHHLLAVGHAVDEAVPVGFPHGSPPDAARPHLNDMQLLLGASEEPFELVPVRSVTHGATVAVYDLAVDGEHEFVANGIVVHNCYGLKFFENSLLVEDPADPTAFLTGVDDRGLGGGYSGSLLALNDPDVTPGLTQLDAADHRSRHAEASTDLPQGELASLRATAARGGQGQQVSLDDEYFRLTELGGRVALPSKAAASGGHVGGVLGRGAERPVPGVVADGVVARVANHQARRDGADELLEAPAVRSHRAALGVAEGEAAVAAGEPTSRPRVAGVRPAAGVDLGQVAVHGGLSAHEAPRGGVGLHDGEDTRSSHTAARFETAPGDRWLINGAQVLTERVGQRVRITYDEHGGRRPNYYQTIEGEVWQVYPDNGTFTLTGGVTTTRRDGQTFTRERANQLSLNRVMAVEDAGERAEAKLAWMKSDPDDPHSLNNLNPADYEWVQEFDYGFEDAILKSIGAIWQAMAEAGQNPTTAMFASEYDEIERWKAQLAQIERNCIPGRPFRENGRCDHCGTIARYFSVFRYKPSGEWLCVGHTCAENRLGLATREDLNKARHQWVLKGLETKKENAEKDRKFNADPRRVKVRDFLFSYRKLVENREYREVGFYEDLLRSLKQYHDLTEGQLAAVERGMDKFADEVEEYALRKRQELQDESNAQPCPSGTETITGKVLSTKYQESQYGGAWKMLVRDDRGFKVWGTIPNSIDVERMDRVTFVATVEPSDDDPLFGFFRRPRKAEVLPRTASSHSLGAWSSDAPSAEPIDRTPSSGAASRRATDSSGGASHAVARPIKTGDSTASRSAERRTSSASSASPRPTGNGSSPSRVASAPSAVSPRPGSSRGDSTDSPSTMTMTPGRFVDSSAPSATPHWASSTTTPTSSEPPSATWSDLGSERPRKAEVLPRTAAQTGARMARTATRRLAYGETMAPSQVSTLRDDSCPVCGEVNGFNGERCMTCGYFKPPDEFMDPDLTKAKEVDLRQDKEETAEIDATGDTDDVFDLDGPGDQPNGDPNTDGDPEVQGEVSLPPEATTPAQEGAQDAAQTPAPVDLKGHESPPPDDQPMKANPDAEKTLLKGDVFQLEKPTEEVQERAKPDAEVAPQPAASPAEGDSAPKSEQPAEDEAVEDEPEQADEDSEDEDEESDSPVKKKPPKQATRRNRGESNMRPALKALAEQQIMLTANRQAIQAIATLAGVDVAPIYAQAERRIASLQRRADAENPAQPVPEPGSEAPSQSSSDALGDLNDADVTTAGEVTSEDGLAGTTVDVTAVGEVMADEAAGTADVTTPTSGIEVSENETQISGDVTARGFDAENAFPIEAQKRVFASLRLARMRITAGIAQGEDLVLGEEIAKSAMSNAAIDAEIATLSRVRAASNRQPTPSAPVRADRRSVPSLGVTASASTPIVGSDPDIDGALLFI